MTNTIALVLAVLLRIETGGHPSPDTAIGDSGKAVGCLQMHAIAVAEANRLVKRAGSPYNAPGGGWTPAHRLSRKESLRMAEVILRAHYERGATDPEELACRWNRPSGKVPEAYRGKVRRVLKTFQAS
jgi:hypothetical protein